jgi:hypothetical protein
MWSADSKRLLFWGRGRTEDPYDVWAVEVDRDSPPVQTGAGATLAHQSINSPRLVAALTAANEWVFSAEHGLFRLPIDPVSWKARGRAEPITFGTSADMTPSAAPDGSVAFESGATSVGVWSLPVNANRAQVTGPALKITTGASHHVRPVVSKDGSLVAFGSDRTGNEDIWLKDMRTGVERVVVNTTAREISGAISPDRKQIAYSVAGGPGEGLRIAPVAGGAVREVCQGCDSWFEWVSSTEILGVGWRQERYVGVLVSDQGQERWTVRHSKHNIFSPRMAPDQRWVAVSVNQGQGRASIWIVPIDSGAPADESRWIRVTQDVGYADKQDWSPDGNVLYFYSTRDGFGCLYAQRLDPGTKRPVGESIAIGHWHSARRSLHNVGLGNLNLSVAADKLVFNLAERTGNVWMLK